jgi:UDP-galactopyranose mutase
MAEPTIIIGGGPAGLGAALHLDGDWLLFEREARIGGHCRTEVIDGFYFDHAGHILFTADPYIQRLIEEVLGDNLHWQARESWIYSKGVFTRYPFQANTYGLPVEVIKECVLGLIEAIYAAPNQPEPANFEEWILRTFGKGIAEHFMLPYNRKVWAVPLTLMSHDWISDRVMQPRLDQVLEGALRPGIKDWGPNARFGYPLRGGFQAFLDGLLSRLDRRRVHTGRGVVAISPRRRVVTLEGGETVAYDYLISTMPLPELVRIIEDVPSAVRDAAAGLLSTTVVCVNLGIRRANITDKHWIYYPEDTVFHRIFVQSNASPYNAPPGCSAYICEITTSPYKPLPREGLVERVIADCQRVGMLRADDEIAVAQVVEIPYGYVIYRPDRAQRVGLIQDYLRAQGIYSAGRFGEWAYYNSDHAILSGKRAAEAVQARRAGEPAVPSGEAASAPR